MANAFLLFRCRLRLGHYLGLLFIVFSSAAFAVCPYGVIHVSSSNHYLDGTASDIAGCVIRDGLPNVGDPVQGASIPSNRTDAAGNPVTTPTPTISANVPGTVSGSCINVPAGYTTTGTGQSCALVPPSTVTSGYGYKWGAGTTVYPTSAGACAAAQSQYGYPTCYLKSEAGTSWIAWICNSSGTCGNSSANPRVTTCPAGYTLSGSTCNLSDAASVKKPIDGTCTILRSGNAYSGDPNDEDCFSPGAPVISGDKVSTPPGNSSSGSSSAQANADGSTTITNSTYNTTNNTTTTTTIIYNSAGKVIGANKQTTSGTGALASTTPSASIDTTGLATSTDIAGVKASVDAAKAQAASDAAQAHADAVAAKAKTDEIAEDLKPSTNTGAPAQPSSLYTPTGKTMESVLGAFKDAMQQKPFYSAATGFFNVSIAGGTCPVWETQAWVFHIRFDQQCSATMQQIWPFIYAIVVACGGFLAFRWAFL